MEDEKLIDLTEEEMGDLNLPAARELPPDRYYAFFIDRDIKNFFLGGITVIFIDVITYLLRI